MAKPGKSKPVGKKVVKLKPVAQKAPEQIIKKVLTKLSASELKYFEGLLNKRKNQLLKNVDNLSSSVSESGTGELSSLPQHLADAAINTNENYMALNLAEGSSDLLREIDSALERIREKTFGMCESCFNQIPKKRLEVIPFGKFCISCQSKEELRK